MLAPSTFYIPFTSQQAMITIALWLSGALGCRAVTLQALRSVDGRGLEEPLSEYEQFLLGEVSSEATTAKDQRPNDPGVMRLPEAQKVSKLISALKGKHVVM